MPVGWNGGGCVSGIVRMRVYMYLFFTAELVEEFLTHPIFCILVNDACIC